MTFAGSNIAFRIATAVAIGLTTLASIGAVPACAQDYAAIIAQADRTEADRATDKRRDPVNLLAFTGPKAGWTVLDMGAGAGYSTELMARSVGTGGKVYGQVDEEVREATFENGDPGDEQCHCTRATVGRSGPLRFARSRPHHLLFCLS